MLLITNRKLDKQRFVASNELSQSILYCQQQGDYTVELGSEVWMRTLQQTKAKQVLIYIHGFNNQPYQDILPRAQQLQAMLDDAGSQTVLIPVIWPCDNNFGIIRDYWDDQLAAELSGQIFSRALGKLLLWQERHADTPCYRPISLLAHSMGNRVMLKTLSSFATSYGNQGVPLLFDQIFLMAADIPNDVLEEDKEGYWITQAGKQLTCFYAKDDLAMPANKVMNVKNRVYTRRLGHSGPKHPIPDLDVIDCSRFNQRFDPIKGHSYFFDSDSPAWQAVVERLASLEIRQP
ncbi:alpha/beta hydrolase [Vibrio furnissii]|uniref:alpha/beta hydrolase n=1 Tax=Vibrio furnissii TaxID=29494 RepID=UPI001302648E|nr:alpha/beta hydrolase [Vibrio furnissii]